MPLSIKSCTEKVATVVIKPKFDESQSNRSNLPQKNLIKVIALKKRLLDFDEMHTYFHYFSRILGKITHEDSFAKQWEKEECLMEGYSSFSVTFFLLCFVDSYSGNRIKFEDLLDSHKSQDVKTTGIERSLLVISERQDAREIPAVGVLYRTYISFDEISDLEGTLSSFMLPDYVHDRMEISPCVDLRDLPHTFMYFSSYFSCFNEFGGPEVDHFVFEKWKGHSHSSKEQRNRQTLCFPVYHPRYDIPSSLRKLCNYDIQCLYIVPPSHKDEKASTSYRVFSLWQYEKTSQRIIDLLSIDSSILPNLMRLEIPPAEKDSSYVFEYDIHKNPYEISSSSMCTCDKLTWDNDMFVSEKSTEFTFFHMWKSALQLYRQRKNLLVLGIGTFQFRSALKTMMYWNESWYMTVFAWMRANKDSVFKDSIFSLMDTIINLANLPGDFRVVAIPSEDKSDNSTVYSYKSPYHKKQEKTAELWSELSRCEDSYFSSLQHLGMACARSSSYRLQFIGNKRDLFRKESLIGAGEATRQVLDRRSDEKKSALSEALVKNSEESVTVTTTVTSSGGGKNDKKRQRPEF